MSPSPRLLLLAVFVLTPRAGEGSEHWAFRTLERPAVPRVPVEGANPVDAFLAASQLELGLEPHHLAARDLLLRRLSLDVLGLPPTVEERRDFLEDRRPEARGRLVDRLLASPHYGERWGRHFLDIWRYTDWFGLGAQLRNSQKHIWHWRDWVVESLNEDLGYDRMLSDMLAADEFAPADQGRLRATGFLARNYYLFNRTTWIDETIEHTAKAFLGLTLNCAKCHDHKYDPLTHEDYYRFRAIFEPHQIRLDVLPGESDLEKDGLPRAFDAHLEAPTFLHRRGDPKDPDESRAIDPGPPSFLAEWYSRPRALDLPLLAHRPIFVPEVERRLIEARRSLLAGSEIALAKRRAERSSTSIAEAEVALARAELAALESALAAERARAGDPPAAEAGELARAAALARARREVATSRLRLLRAERTLLDSEGDARKREAAEKEVAAARKELQASEAKLAAPGQNYSLPRGSRKALEGPDESAASRDAPYPRSTTGRRTALARWLVDRQNPLTARVIVNHVWLRHFGTALVPTVADFGTRAPEPLHRELLDWLAIELIESGWSLKHLHRLLLSSEAYARSSEIPVDDQAAQRNHQRDPGNETYWRRNSIRLESQAIRDSLLALSGELDLKMGGAPVPTKDSHRVRRRSLYFVHSRDDREAFLRSFDDADILACYRRPETVAPQQALALVNSRVALESAARIAKYLSAQDDTSFTRAAWARILGREPDRDELSACLETLENFRSLAREGESSASERARLVHALLNHNDFVTLR